MEDLARMELERGEYLSPVCNKETRDGLSQCITTGSAGGLARPYQLHHRISRIHYPVTVVTRPESPIRVSGVPDKLFA